MKAKVFLSAFAGFLFGLFGYFVFRLIDFDLSSQIAVSSGLLFALLLFPFLVVYEKVVNRRYAKFEQEITSPIFYRTNGNFNLGNGEVKNGNIYFCEAGIVCVCLEDKPYTLDEILLQDIDHYQFDDIHLNIFAKGGQIFVITLPDAQKIIEVLREKGWV